MSEQAKGPRMTVGTWLTIGVFACFGIFGLTLFRVADTVISQDEERIAEFFTALNNGQYETAFGSTSSAWQAITENANGLAQQFQDLTITDPTVGNRRYNCYTDLRGNTIGPNSVSYLSVSGSARVNGEVASFSVQFIYENDRYTVHGVRLAGELIGLPIPENCYRTQRRRIGS